MNVIGEAIVFDLRGNECFGCSQERSDSLAMVFTRTGEKTVEAAYSVPAAYRGMGGVVHGGFQAVLIDEAVSVAAYLFWPPETYTVTTDLSLRYKRPVPVEQPIVVRGELLEEDEQGFRATAAILDASGMILTEGTATQRKRRYKSGVK